MKPDDTDEVHSLLDFLRAAERLKNVTRSAWTSEGNPESVAEHTWRLCLMALVFRDHFPGIDIGKLLSICVVHDLGEAIRGDTPAPEQNASAPKAAEERADLISLLEPLPARLRQQLADLWDEYEAAESAEAKLAKALDKLETILQHNQGRNPYGFDYRFNIQYGRRFTENAGVLSLVRQVLDEETEARAKESG